MTNATTDPAALAVATASVKTPTEHVRDFAAALRRRWPAALLVFALTLVSTAVLTSMEHKKYAATAQILLQPTDAVKSAISPGSVSSPADAQRDVNTYAQLITVEPVANAVRRQLGLSTNVHALVRLISISGEESSNLVSITATVGSPARAAQLATAFASQYQIYRRQTAVQQINQALLTAKTDQQASIAGSPVALRVAQLQAAAAAETGGVQIIRVADAPSSPVSPNLPKSLVVGLIAALILAAAVVYGLEAVDRRLRGVSQFRAAFGAPVLATIPGVERPKGARGLHTARRRAYTDLATRLTFTDAAKSCRTIMISPASEREDADAFALGLAQALGTLGRRVVLIEANLASAPASRGGAEEPGGLTSVLTGRSSFLREVSDVHFVDGSAGRAHELEPWALISYSTLHRGPRVAEPEALLGRAAMREVLADAKARGDLVLVTAAPMDHPSGVLPLARLSDGIILVADRRSTKADQAAEIVELLSQIHTPLLGAALVAVGSPEQSTTDAERGFAGLVPPTRREISNGNGGSSDPRPAAAHQDERG
jgi:capsular polysaccharide biosynthesis protein